MTPSSSGIRRQLGTIMIEEGYLTVEQLELAIAEQHRHAKPLGQVLVELGLVATGVVANALAEQHGASLETEFGVSAGFHPQAAEPATDLQPHQVGHGLVGDAEGSADRRRLIGELDELRARCESLGRGVSVLASELERLRDSIQT